MRQLLDVVRQAVELPLRIHFLLPPQGKAVELLVVPQVAEHRLHRGEAPAVSRLSFGTVDAGFHFVGEGFRPISFALKETHLPGLGLGRGAQALVAMTARYPAPSEIGINEGSSVVGRSPNRIGKAIPNQMVGGHQRRARCHRLGNDQAIKRIARPVDVLRRIHHTTIR